VTPQAALPVGPQLYNQAISLVGAGQYPQAQRMALLASSAFDEEGDEVGLAMACQLLATISLDTYRLDEVLSAANVARQLFERNGQPADVARTDSIEAQARWLLGDYPGAVRLLERASKAFAAADRGDGVAGCQLQLGYVLSSANRLDEAREHIEAARQFLVDHGDPPGVAQCDVALGLLERQAGRLEDAEKRLADAYSTLREAGRRIEAAKVTPSLGEVYESLGRYDEAEKILREGRRLHSAAGSLVGMAYCDARLAQVLVKVGRDKQALEAALASVAVTDAQRYSLANPMSREHWAMLHYGIYKTALNLARKSGDQRLMAELIESARAQAVPVPTKTDEPAPRTGGPGAVQSADRPRYGDVASAPTYPLEDRPASAGRTLVDSAPIAPARRLLVEGKSALYAARPKGMTTPKPIDLTRVATDVGGGDTWWWGSWQADESLWWSLISPEGRVHAGQIDIAPGSRLRNALEKLHEGLPYRGEGEDVLVYTDRLRASPLADRQAEETLTTELSECLLPPPLLDALREHPADDPLALAVAPCPTVAPIPLPCLPIGSGRRLIEAATVQFTASAVFMADLDAYVGKGRADGGPGPLLVGVFDPDPRHPLPNAQQLADAVSAQLKLTGEQATVPALREALAGRVRPGQAGMLVYAGHARTPATGAALLCLAKPHDGAIDCPHHPCCGGNPLTAADLCARAPWAEEFDYPMPGRVLLSACDTAGARAAGVGGEWLALAPSILWAGARLVVATAWPTLEDRRTLELDTAIVDILTSEEDPVAALRGLQVEYLNRWRGGTGLSSGAVIQGWSPLYWAPYLAVGFRDC
jgi:tetratricopeptide (TPR) repeat protein